MRSAATNRSPSFSRSSSSTTITNLPSLMSATASGTVARLIGRRSLPAEVSLQGSLMGSLQGSLDVTGDYVGLEVDHGALLVAVRDRVFQGVGNQGDLEGAGRLVDRRHCEADAVDRDRALDRDEPRKGGGQLDRDLFARCDVRDRSD